MKIRAAVLASAGHAPPFREGLPFSIEDVELDDPGPGEVLVRIAAAGLCHSDLSAITGQRARALPAVGGHEASGVVAAVGSDVEQFAAGDHVVMVFVSSCESCRLCTAGRPNLCQSAWAARAEGTLAGGARRLRRAGEPLNHWSGISAFAEYAVVSSRSLVALDAAVPLDVAALFGCAVLTGVGAVVNTARVASGRSVAVVGLGGVGLSALLGALAVGAASVVAVDVSPAKLELATSLGATHVFDARDGDSVHHVREELGGGADFVFEMAGSAPAAAMAYAITGRGGTMVTAGLPDSEQRLHLPLADLVASERTVKGSYMGSAQPRRDVPAFVRMYQEGLLPVDRLLSSHLGLEQINEGFDRLAAGASVRDVIDPRR